MPWFSRIVLITLIVLSCAARAQIPRDTVVMAKEIDDFVSLDPAEAYEFSDIEAIANCYDRLLDYTPRIPRRSRARWRQAGASIPTARPIA